MNTIKRTYQFSFREKRSKFIGYLFPISSKDDFNRQLDEIKSEYHDATHHCYAWRINPNQIEEFSQDDGEPGGTAGQPILNKLKSYKVVNGGCIVVRYYGGTNLGTSGLIQAYGRATELCLEEASLYPIIRTKNFKITYPYNQQKEIDQIKNTFDLKEIDAEYTDTVHLILACRKEQADAFEQALRQIEHKGISANVQGNSFVTF